MDVSYKVGRSLTVCNNFRKSNFVINQTEMDIFKKAGKIALFSSFGLNENFLQEFGEIIFESERNKQFSNNLSCRYTFFF